MDITYRLTGPWGAGKGANLQPSEVDYNFWNIAQAIVDLETNPAQPVGIENISMSGSEMTITLTDGTVMGPFLIPVLAFVWRGEWQPTTSYAELDVFTKSDTGIFLTLLAHTSGEAFDPNIQVGDPPAPALQKLFGATDGTLAGLADVDVTSPTSGQLLQYDGSLWVNVDLGAFDEGIIALYAGTGISASPDPIISSGSISLAPIGDRNLLANTSGDTVPPVGMELTQFLDAAAGSVRGSVLIRNSIGWLPLAPGTAGQYLKTMGLGADAAWDSPAGTGTVISVAAGSGISTGGSPITSAGTVSLAAIANLNLLANIGGSSAAPVATTLSLLIDAAIGSTQGSILYRSGTAWVALAPGTAGQVLTTGGASANPSWSTGSGGGGGIPEAPSDGTYYGRRNAAWSAVAPLASPTFTGTPSVPTATAGTNTTQAANTAFVQTALAAAGGITQLTGDVTAGPGSGSQAATLASTAVTPGSYTSANITVDAKGRVTAAANGAGAATVPHPGYRSGVYYTRPLSAVGTNAAVTANRIYAFPVLIASAITIDALQILVGTVGAAGSLADIGLYANASGAVGSLVRDFGTVTTATSLTQSITGFTQALAAGWHFLAIGFSGTPSVLSTAGTDVSQQHLLGFSTLAGSFQGNQGWIANWTFSAGALPSTLASPSLNSLSFPIVAFRVQ